MNGDSLRPSCFAEYVGQTDMKRELDVRIRSAKATGKPLADILLVGTAGTGKTALAQIIGVELGEPTVILNCPVSLPVLAKVVRQHVGILVLDEIHTLSKVTLEALLPLLEFRTLALPNGQHIEAEWLTIIGTTTERIKIIPPLWDRFASKPTFVPYSPDELCQIVIGMATKADVPLDRSGALLYAHACLGKPRVARQFIVAYADLLAAAADAGEPVPTAADALTLLQTEGDGLTLDHLKYLKTLDLLGGTKGLAVISTFLSLHEGVVVDLERVLQERELIVLTEKGRELTTAGYRRLREIPPLHEQLAGASTN